MALLLWWMKGQHSALSKAQCFEVSLKNLPPLGIWLKVEGGF